MSDQVSQGSSSVPTDQGVLIVVVGPSGAGKDTLMDFAAAKLAGRNGIHFVQRAITRASEAGGENHKAMTQTEFDHHLDGGDFCVSWQAHGLSYGIPASLHETLGRGDVAIVNGSRSALEHFSRAFPALKVINIVATPDVLASRLESRGRESREEILRRLGRSSIDVCGDFDVATIDNSGALETSGAAFVALIETYMARKG